MKKKTRCLSPAGHRSAIIIQKIGNTPEQKIDTEDIIVDIRRYNSCTHEVCNMSKQHLGEMTECLSTALWESVLKKARLFSKRITTYH